MKRITLVVALFLLWPASADAVSRNVSLRATNHTQHWLSRATYDAGNYKVRLHLAGHEIGLRGGNDGCHGHFRHGPLRARVIICGTAGHVRLDYSSVARPVRFRLTLRFTPQIITIRR